jgi:hypothetical protein
MYNTRVLTEARYCVHRIAVVVRRHSPLRSMGRKGASLNAELEEPEVPKEKSQREQYKALGNKKPKNKTQKGHSSTWANEM